MTLQDQLDTHRNVYPLTVDRPTPQELSLTASFIIPVFNSAQSITYAVASIAAQRRADLINEIVLINDGSNDSSLEVIKNIASIYHNLNIVLLDNGSRRYAAYSRNRGIERCTGDLIFFIDSDIIIPTDYLVEHVRQHQVIGPCITFSLRKNITNRMEAQFPAKDAKGDFRETILKENALSGKPFNFCTTHNLAEMCLTCSVAYRRRDLELVRGCPENFVGWGYNDTAMATKVIALGRPVVPVLSTTVFHLEHAPRSGNSSRKWAEFYQNQKRYQKMLELPVVDTFQHTIEALEL